MPFYVRGNISRLNLTKNMALVILIPKVLEQFILSNKIYIRFMPHQPLSQIILQLKN